MELTELTEQKPLSYEEKFKQVTNLDFNTFYKKYYPKLVWQIQKLNINVIDAEGIANNAFIQSIDKIDQYNPNHENKKGDVLNFSTWLFTVGKNMAYKFKKDNAKIVLVDTNSSGSDNDDSIAFDAMQYHQNMKMDNYHGDLESQTITDLKALETLKEIEKLGPKYKTIVELCDIEGFSYNDIIDLLGAELEGKDKLQTVKNRLFHGRAKLEKNLTKKFNYIQDNY